VEYLDLLVAIIPSLFTVFGSFKEIQYCWKRIVKYDEPGSLFLVVWSHWTKLNAVFPIPKSEYSRKWGTYTDAHLHWPVAKWPDARRCHWLGVTYNQINKMYCTECKWAASKLRLSFIPAEETKRWIIATKKEGAEFISNELTAIFRACRQASVEPCCYVHVPHLGDFSYLISRLISGEHWDTPYTV